MEKLEKYRRIVKELASEYALEYQTRDIQTELIHDPVLDHYEVQWIGFDKNEYYNYGTILHLDIRNGKVWLQFNGTECMIAQELVDKGIPKSDIVLGFQPPSKRPFTGYATG